MHDVSFSAIADLKFLKLIYCNTFCGVKNVKTEFKVNIQCNPTILMSYNSLKCQHLVSHCNEENEDTLSFRYVLQLVLCCRSRQNGLSLMCENGYI